MDLILTNGKRDSLGLRFKKMIFELEKIIHNSIYSVAVMKELDFSINIDDGYNYGLKINPMINEYQPNWSIR